MEHQKTNSRIYNVIEEERKRKSKGKRMCRCRGTSQLKIQPQIKINFTHLTIMFSHRFLCNEYIGLQLQTKECNWTRRQFHHQQVEVV